MENTRVKRLPHPRYFAGKFFKSFVVGLIVLLISLSIGVAGYHYYFRLGWIDSLYNASMILTGMGPVDKATSASGKIFASGYALYSGIAFLSSVAIIFSPVMHRFMHKFKLDVEE